MAGKSKVKTPTGLTKSEIDRLDRLDEIIQDENLAGHDRFLSALINSEIPDKVFCGKDDEYIGMLYHCLTIIYKYKKDSTMQKSVIEIINRALLGINGLTVAKLLADDLADFARVISERGLQESTRLWWFSNGGIAVEDLKNIIRKLAPTSFPLFNWDKSLILIKDGLKSDKDYTKVRYKENSDKTKTDKNLKVEINKQKKQELYEAATIEDPFEAESVVYEFEYSPESFEALSDALKYWGDLLQSKRKKGASIFDLNEELGVIRAIVEAILESAVRYDYPLDILEELLDFLQNPIMIDDGDTDLNDESHEIRLEAIGKIKKLLHLLK